jgi:diphthamide biosynthesis protein 7
MQSVQHLQSLTLDLPPSCIEFCPRDSQYAVIGTHNLEKPDAEQAAGNEGSKGQVRNGSLILVRLAGNKV